SHDDRRRNAPESHPDVRHQAYVCTRRPRGNPEPQWNQVTQQDQEYQDGYGYEARPHYTTTYFVHERPLSLECNVTTTRCPSSRTTSTDWPGSMKSPWETTSTLRPAKEAIPAGCKGVSAVPTVPSSDGSFSGSARGSCVSDVPRTSL